MSRPSRTNRHRPRRPRSGPTRPQPATAACAPSPVEVAVAANFGALGVDAETADRLAADGITVPTPIQTAAVPAALAGRDVLGHAPTGSGKTLAFSLPLAATVTRAGRPSALVLAPTRELASQIAATVETLPHRLRVRTFFGGTSVGKDVAALRAGVDVVVGCPGRLSDLVSRGELDLGQVSHVVIDEADRMADMGFIAEVLRLVGATRADRQLQLYSATLDGPVARLTELLRDPTVVSVAKAAGQVEVDHHFWDVDRSVRRRTVTDLLRTCRSAIVFVRTKHGADRLTKQLKASGIPAAAIHGNRSQPQREKALAAFAAGSVKVLIATDIAARGIHVDQVQLVVHYDLPATSADYVHRTGRTGRAGAPGTVVALVEPERRDDARDIMRELSMKRPLAAADVSLLT